MMLKGFQLIDNNWYYFNEDSKEVPVGAMFIGFAISSRAYRKYTDCTNYN